MGAHFSFIHCADLHLGARFKGLTATDPVTARKLRQSVFDSFKRIVDVGLKKDVDAMFIAGDAFHESTITPADIHFFATELGRFGKPVFLCRGNHDPQPDYAEFIPYPENVHVFGTEPERLPIPGIDGAEAVGVSFASWHEERNLPAMLNGTPGVFTVACVHCDVDGTSDIYNYSRCRKEDFLGKNVDYWAIGHIHKREVVMENPPVVYPGNIQGRSFKETGEKGAYLVTVKDGRIDLKFISTQGVVWYDEEFDITGKKLADLERDIFDRVGKKSILRITLKGMGELDRLAREKPSDLIEMIRKDTGVIVSEIDVRSTPAIDIASRREGIDMTGTVIRCGDGLKSHGRAFVRSILQKNSNMKTELSFFDDLSDAEIDELTDSAVRYLASWLEGSK